METIINTFRIDGTETKTPYYPNNQIIKKVYESGQFSIYKLSSSHVHTWNGYAIAELVGCNKELIEHLRTQNEPKMDSVMYHLYKRANGYINRAKHHFIKQIDCSVCDDKNGCDQVKYDCPKANFNFLTIDK